MLYAKIVLGLPVEGPFDYIVPQGLEEKAAAGSRAWVNFCHRKMVGFIVGLSDKSGIKNLKKISEIIDDAPLLDKNMLLFTRELARYYCCSWGEVIYAALPEGLREGRRIEQAKNSYPAKTTAGKETILLHDPGGEERWKTYFDALRYAAAKEKSVILIFPDKISVLKARTVIQDKLGLPVEAVYRKMAKELDQWARIKGQKASIIAGTLSCVFSPVNNLGLVIVDDENDPAYKQDQVPHYNVREAARIRTDIEKANLIFASGAPSLESLYLAREGKIKYIFTRQSLPSPEVKIVDMKSEYSRKHRDRPISLYLRDSIVSSLAEKEKVLLLLNRKGFATYTFCHNCGVVLKCPRCNINLVYHFHDNSLDCHYCNFKMDTPKICPACNSGYIKFSGAGTEKIESELSRLFPQAKIKRPDGFKGVDLKEADIFVSTSAATRQKNLRFGLTAALAIDNLLNRVDFRSSEKAFALLTGLAGLTEKKLIIQTSLTGHYCFQALLKQDPALFYDEELKLRKQLGLPPFKHLVLVKIRGKAEEKVKERAQALFERFNRSNTAKGIKVVSVNCAQQYKLRNNFYWNILLSGSVIGKINNFIRFCLNDFRHSGIIITVDVDPV